MNVATIKNPRTSLLLPPSLYFAYSAASDEIVPHDQGGFILTHEEWLALKAELEKFYVNTAPQVIANHNERCELHWPGDEQELTVHPPSTYQSPRAGDYKIRRRLIRERGLKCEDCPKVLTKKTIEMHHVIRVVDGGTSEDSNLKLLCHECHLKYRLPARSREVREPLSESNAI